MSKSDILRFSGVKLHIAKPVKLYKIKHPDGQYKKVYEYKTVPGTQALIISSTKDFVCTEEDKVKISLFKGCTWELVTAEDNKDEVKKV